ncbi:hypothetical protein QAD02_024174 [Eretmocerus hayati]|uniref:Uncharacterized protein n=1 Tax=Eretmocerus hayati TaxID=131215 RepID=A0ACC2PYN5_9HYME|nr:hypothetical protein QAD02_024174 [Eretmocerus hayati]
MSLATPDILNAISDLAKIREMKIALNVSAQCGLIASISTMLGGLVGGPRGIAIGGSLGTALAYFHGNGKFKSVPEILANDATPQQKEKLADAIRNLVTPENIFTIIQFTAALQNNQFLMEQVIKLVRNFLMSDMGYNCIL